MKTKLDYFNIIQENIPDIHQQQHLLKDEVEKVYPDVNLYFDFRAKSNRELAIGHNIDTLLSQRYRDHYSYLTETEFIILTLKESYNVLAIMIKIFCTANDLSVIIITNDNSFIVPNYKTNILDENQNKSVVLDYILNVKY